MKLQIKEKVSEQVIENLNLSKLVKNFMLSCNPKPKRFYGSLMLSRGGKLFLKNK